MAGAIAEISRMTLRRDFRRLDTASVRVILIDLADRVLGTFAPALSARARRDLEALGVELLLGTRVVGVDERGLTAETAGGRVRIEANNVVWAAGVKASPLGACLGAELDSSGRVIVGDDLTPSGLPKVFVAGDLARRVDPRTGEPVPGVAQGAIQMGRFVGRTLAAEINALGRGRSAPARGVFAYDDKGQMATIGRNRAVAQIRGLRLGGVLAFLIWAFIHVLALIGFRRRLIVLAEWIWIYFFAVRGVRLITGDERVPKPVKPPPDPRLGSPPEA
jgi:NADH dehydrogenase